MTCGSFRGGRRRPWRAVDRNSALSAGLLCVIARTSVDYTVSYMGTEPNVPPPLHELEAEVMDEMWRREEATVRAVIDALNDRAPKPRAYTTFMTIMSRLHTKGL